MQKVQYRGWHIPRAQSTLGGSGGGGIIITITIYGRVTPFLD